MHEVKCIKQSKKSGLMFIKDEIYSVEKCKTMSLHKYVIVCGKFTNAHNQIKKLKRIFLASICKEHLEYIK